MKKWIFVLVLIAMAILFSGCLQKNESALDATPQVTPQSPQEVQELKKPLLPKSVPLTPGETVEAFWMTIKEERYTDATKYLDPLTLKEIEQISRREGHKNIEETLFYMTSGSLVDQIERIEITYGKGFYSTTKRWSEKGQKGIEYETVVLTYRAIDKNDKSLGGLDAELIKIEGVWKISKWLA